MFMLFIISSNLHAIGNESDARWLVEKEKYCKLKISEQETKLENHSKVLLKDSYNESILSNLILSKKEYIKNKCNFENFDSLGTQAESILICDCLIHEYNEFNEYLIEKINTP